MSKIILITGSTDGIGFATAEKCLMLGHDVIIHGRNGDKLASAQQALQERTGRTVYDSFSCDLSYLKQVYDVVNVIKQKYSKIDVLINNAGVFVVPEPVMIDKLDVRFTVNCIAPYMLTKGLLPLMGTESRVVNLSSAAQMRVDKAALYGQKRLQDSNAYAQSKLALTMWSMYMGRTLKDKGPAIIAVNPKSFLGTKMVKVAYGRHGYDIGIGADILVRAALSDAFSNAAGMYFDNDIEAFTQPHQDALDIHKCSHFIQDLDTIITKTLA